MKEFSPKQRGEWFEFGFKLTNPLLAGKPPVDVTGKTVTLVVREGPEQTDPVIAVTGGAGWIVDGPGGDVAVGGRISRLGAAYGTTYVGTEADGPGWPQIEPWSVQITDCP